MPFTWDDPQNLKASEVRLRNDLIAKIEASEARLSQKIEAVATDLKALQAVATDLKALQARRMANFAQSSRGKPLLAIPGCDPAIHTLADAMALDRPTTLAQLKALGLDLSLDEAEALSSEELRNILWANLGGVFVRPS